jgi:PDZ domain
VYPGTAAAAAGLQVGDHLVAVSGAPLAGRSVAAAFDAVELHVPVRLTIERAGVRSEVSLLRGPVDPLLWGLFDAAGAQECRTAEMLAPDAALLERVESAAFDASRAFRCTDAHRRLSGAAPPGTVLVVRGGTRILLVVPGSGSRCVSVAEADGAPPALLKSWLDELTRAYVADRHRHP